MKRITLCPWNNHLGYDLNVRDGIWELSDQFTEDGSWGARFIPAGAGPIKVGRGKTYKEAMLNAIPQI